MNPRERRKAIQEHLAQQRAKAEQYLSESQRVHEEEVRRQYEAHLAYWRERGWKPMNGEPLVLPTWQCLRCSCLAFDRELHDAWHASMGQEWQA